MSMVPMLFRDWWDDLEVSRPSRLVDQHFGTALNREELLNTISSFPRTSVLNRYYRPWRTLAKADSGSTISADADKFQVILDVQQFAPDEIAVKVSGGSIVVEGKHAEKQDEHGFVARHFVRRYVVPQEHDVDGVVSTLSSDGVLTVSVPKKGKEEKGERVVPITQTGPAKAE